MHGATELFFMLFLISGIVCGFVMCAVAPRYTRSLYSGMWLFFAASFFIAVLGVA